MASQESISPSNSNSSLSNLSLSPSRLSSSSTKSSSSSKSKSDHQSPKRSDVAEKEGVIYIKLPTESRSSSWKVWTRKYASIKPDLILGAESVITSALVTIGKSEKASPFSEDVMFKKWFTPDNSIVFRSKSRTQAYSFTICVESEPVIHLAAGSECETQSWISTFRSILWPSNPFTSLEKTVGSLFEISLIDNEFSYRSGLLGAFGNLQITTQKAVLLDSVHGSVIQEWSLSSVGFKILPQPHPEDRDKIVTMITDNNSTTGYGTIIMFCNEAINLINRVHEVRQMFKKNTYKDQFREDIPDGDSLNESFSRRIESSESKSECNRDTLPRILVSDTATTEAELRATRSLDRSISDPWLRKIIEGPGPSEPGSNSLPSTPMTESPTERGERPTSLGGSGSGNVSKTQSKAAKGTSPVRRLFSWKNIGNIPESMLDSSITSHSLSMQFKNNCKTIDESVTEEKSEGKKDDDEEDEDEYHSLHEAIAEEAEAEEHNDTEDGKDEGKREEEEKVNEKSNPPMKPRRKED